MGSLFCHDAHHPLPIGFGYFISDFLYSVTIFQLVLNCQDLDIVFSIMRPFISYVGVRARHLRSSYALPSQPIFSGAVGWKESYLMLQKITSHFNHRTNSIPTQRGSQRITQSTIISLFTTLTRGVESSWSKASYRVGIMTTDSCDGW